MLVKRLATVLCYVEFYPCHVQNGLSKLRSKRITVRGKNKSGQVVETGIGQVSFVTSLKSSGTEYRIHFCISIFFFHRISTATGFFYRDLYDRFRTLCIFRFQEPVDATW